MGWMGGYLRLTVCLEHLTVLIMTTNQTIMTRTQTKMKSSQTKVMIGYPYNWLLTRMFNSKGE